MDGLQYTGCLASLFNLWSKIQQAAGAEHKAEMPMPAEMATDMSPASCSAQVINVSLQEYIASYIDTEHNAIVVIPSGIFYLWNFNSFYILALMKLSLLWNMFVDQFTILAYCELSQSLWMAYNIQDV